MKNYIRKELKKLGRTRTQLYDGLKFKNFITDWLLFSALYDMVKDEEILKCYGGYYVLNN